MAIEEPLEGAAAEHNAPVKGEEDRFDSSTAQFDHHDMSKSM
jgi:hypothetical protein